MRNLAPRSLTVALALVALASCSTDTPTAPESTPAPPPGSSPTTAWNITVTVEPRDLTASSEQPATVTVEVRRAADGTVPQDDTTVVVSAGLGEFDSSGSGVTTATISLRGGLASLLYFAGAILGTDTIEAQLESSLGSAKVNIIQAAEPFIVSVSPTSGPERGGTRIRISGTGFSDPSRVAVGGVNATVDAIGEDAQGEFIRAFTGAVPDPDTFFTNTEGCDIDGDGVNDGQRFLPKTVEVSVTAASGESPGSLENAFTYRPRDTSCRETSPQPDSPSANFSFVVDGLMVQFFNESTPGAGLTFNWSFGDGSGFDTTENPSHDYTAAGAGDYDVTLRVENSSGSSTRTKTVTVP